MIEVELLGKKYQQAFARWKTSRSTWRMESFSDWWGQMGPGKPLDQNLSRRSNFRTAAARESAATMW